jgi:hypothetical protein
VGVEECDILPYLDFSKRVMLLQPCRWNMEREEKREKKIKESYMV